MWIELVAAALFGLVVSVLFHGPVESAVVRIFGPLAPAGRSRSVKGMWHSYYEIVKDGSQPSPPGTPLDPSRIEQIKLSQVGTSIIGKNDKRSRRYFLRLTLDDGCILTGRWSDVSGGRYHYGGVQLRWDYSGRYMIGKFVGRDRHNQIKHGPWAFARIPTDLQEVVDEWRSEVRRTGHTS